MAADQGAERGGHGGGRAARDGRHEGGGRVADRGAELPVRAVAARAREGAWARRRRARGTSVGSRVQSRPAGRWIGLR